MNSPILRRQLLFLFATLALTAAASAVSPDNFDQHPLPDDLVLPMPNGARMVFRPVFLGIGTDGRATREYGMGDRTGQHGEEPSRTVSVGGSFIAENNGRQDRLFYIGKYPVTEAQFTAVSAASVEQQQAAPQSRLPQTNITRRDMDDFVDKYNAWLLRNAPDQLPEHAGARGFLRLPTEEEWEFAARGGNAGTAALFDAVTPYSGELQRYEWFGGPRSSFGKLKEVGLLEPNPLGLYDMLGNAAEMTDTMYQLAGQTGGYTVRGGSFRTPEEDIRASLRTEQPRFNRDNLPSHEDTVGFRLVIAAQVFTFQNRSEIEAAEKQEKTRSLAAEKHKVDKLVPQTDEAHKFELAAEAAKSMVDDAKRNGTLPMVSPTASPEFSPAATPPPIAFASPTAEPYTVPAATPNTAPEVPQPASVTAAPPPDSKLVLTYLDAALHEAETNIDPPQLVDELCEIAQERAKAGDIEASHSILAQAKTIALNFSPGLDDERNVALSKIAESEVQVGDKKAAQVYVAEVSATIAATHDLFSRATALSRLGHVQSIIGDIDDSRRTFELAEKAAAQQKNSWSRNHCLTEIAKDQAQTEAQPGNLEAARQTLIRAIGLANALKGSTVRPGLLTDIARTQVQIGENDGAKRTLKEASDCAVRMKETYEKGDTLRDLAQAQAEAGDIAGANSTTARITDKYDGAKYTYKEEALTAIGNATAAAAQAQLLRRIQEQAKEGGAKDAELTVRTWGSASDRCDGYIQIAIGLLSN